MSDLLMNEGSFYAPQIDEADQQEANKERAETLEAMPILEDIISWFDLQAKELNTVTSIDLKHPKLTVEEQIHGHQVAIDLLNKKKGEFKSLIEAYKPKR